MRMHVERRDAPRLILGMLALLTVENIGAVALAHGIRASANPQTGFSPSRHRAKRQQARFSWLFPTFSFLFLVLAQNESTMDSINRQLEELMSIDADTELRFDDGVLKANSTVLSFFSSVLRGAIEADKSSSSSNRKVIPMEGLTTAQWLEVAPFWHPVDPAPVVKTWEEAELLLEIGSRFNLRPALDKVSEYLLANMDKLTAAPTPNSTNSSNSSIDETVWKWLRLADQVCLTSCLPAMVKRAVKVDRAGCSNNTQGLSAATLQQLVAELVTSGPYSLGQQVYRRCPGGCRSSVGQLKVCLRCSACSSITTHEY